MLMIVRALVVLASLLPSAPILAQSPPFDLRLVADGFSRPLLATAPVGDPRLFLVEQTGAIRIVEDGVVKEQPFLNVADLIVVAEERGLLGLAFHPNYAENGTFYVNYTDLDSDTQIVAYTVSSDPDIADPTPVSTILSIEQSHSANKGGWMAFGPDGFFYIGTGDGGGAIGSDTSQNLDLLLGKILRIDVDAAAPYGIPPDNPYAGGGGAPEIFLYGLRNPWRVAFDGDQIYIADPGENHWDEINVISFADRGGNLGWDVMEGANCVLPATTCERTGLIMPVHSFPNVKHCAVIGGHVYRGAAIPALDWVYFFSDYCTGVISSFRYGGDGLSDLTSYAEAFGKVGDVTSFGLDSSGELYLVTQQGALLKFVPR